MRIAVVGRTSADDPIRLGDAHLAKAMLGLGHRVVWVDPPTRWGAARGGHAPFEGLEVVSPRVLPGTHRLASGEVVDAVVARAVRDRGPIDLVVVADPRRAGVGRMLDDITRVYWCRDRFEAGRSKHQEDASRQRLHLAAYDLVTAVSPGVARSLHAVVDDVVVVANGCDAAHFAATPPRHAGRGALGLLGGVGWRVDVELLDGLATRRPDVDIVVIGEDVSGALPRHPNIEHRGRLPYGELPAALAAVEVGLVPYVDDDFNRASFPLKVFEYLAAGRTVVSSPIEALRDLHPFVRLAKGVEETLAAVEDALSGTPTEDACRAFGARNSWTSRATELLDLAMGGRPRRAT